MLFFRAEEILLGIRCTGKMLLILNMFFIMSQHSVYYAVQQLPMEDFYMSVKDGVEWDSIESKILVTGRNEIHLVRGTVC
ncbi:unnamed protein product [Cercopithifilaria johnstoni]|uniref:Uncharacterized protein n=1 Tax=Cercopithifilaria johnstoni TaxID=2874296 RepID=A0A8J2MP45_9BILA|nr:unnamed protein product [Cercopithifilaria johnstoni]